jgi:hypothetical protein
MKTVSQQIAVPLTNMTVSGLRLARLLSIFLFFSVVGGQSAQAQTATQDLAATWFNTIGLSGSVLNNDDVTTINFANFNPNGQGDNYSVIIQGFIEAQETGLYTFRTRSDDGVRLSIGGTQIINNYTDHGPTNNDGSISLVAGQWYPVLLEHYERGGGQTLELRWNPPSGSGFVFPPAAALSKVEPAATTVSIASTTAGTEDSPAGVFTITQTTTRTTPTVVTYTVGGSADSGADFVALSGTATIPAGARTAEIPLTVIDDADVETDEDVTITLTAISSGVATLGTPVIATNTIVDNDFDITVSSSTNGAIVDGGSDVQGTVTVGVPQTITYTVANAGSGTLTLAGTPTVSALNNVDTPVAVSAPGSLSLASGATTTFTVTFTPTAVSAFSFEIDVLSDDADETPFDILVSGVSNAVPEVVLTGPEGPQAGPFTVTATFSEPVFGLDETDFAIGSGAASTLVMVSPTVYTIDVTPSEPGATATVFLPANTVADVDGAMNTASNTLNIASGALSSAQLNEIRDIIVEEAVRTLRSELHVNNRAVRDARERFAAQRACQSSEDSQTGLGELEADCRLLDGTVPLRFSGALQATQGSANLSGSFFGQSGSANSAYRRLVSGDFDVTRYQDGNETVSFNGRIAWETLSSETMMLGYFLGTSVSKSSISGTFSGNRKGYGLQTGAYFVQELDRNLFWDGFIAVNIGQNTLDLTDGALNASSDYTTRSLQTGLSISGIKEYEGFELRPELSFAYGITQIGEVDLTTTTATSSVDDVVDAGDVQLGLLRLTSEFLIPVDLKTDAYDQAELRIAPSLVCEVVRTDGTDKDCGGGLELEWSSFSNDGLQEFSASMRREVVGQQSRNSFGVRFKMDF